MHACQQARPCAAHTDRLTPAACCLQIRRPVDGTLFGNALPGSCNEATINDALTTGGFGVTGVDTYFYVTADKDSAVCAPGTATSGVVAYAAACDFDFDYNRPIQGGINICYHRYVCVRGSGGEGGV